MQSNCFQAPNGKINHFSPLCHTWKLRKPIALSSMISIFCISLIKHSRVQQTASEHLFVMGFSTTEESLLSSSSSIIFELVIVRRIHLLNSRKVSRGGSMFVFHLYKAHRPLTPLLLYYAKYLSQSRDYSSAS